MNLLDDAFSPEKYVPVNANKDINFKKVERFCYPFLPSELHASKT